MDGPQIERMTGAHKANRFIKFMIRIEKQYYRHIRLPDLLIVLRANPDIAVQRKIDETAASVRARSTEIWAINWRQTDAYVINADRSKAEVLSEVKSLIWSQL